MAEKSMKETPAENPAPQAAPAAPQKAKSGFPVIVIILIVVAFLCIICGVGGYVVYNRIRNAAQDAVNNTAQNALENVVKDATGTDISTKSLPDQFPSDVPEYSNGTLTYSSSSTVDSDTIMTVDYNTKDTPSTVKATYKAALKSNGWTITSEYSYVGETLTATKDDRTVTMSASDGYDDQNPTLIVIIVKVPN